MPCSNWLNVVGRLQPSVTLTQAQSDVDMIAMSLDRQFPGRNGWEIRLISLHEVCATAKKGGMIILPSNMQENSVRSILLYSYLSATMGSTRIARRAGM